MKKKIISMTILLVIFFIFNTCIVALAGEGDTQFVTTASQLKSKGAIVYQNETDSVVIDSNDLYILADAFDSFKTAVYSQMAEMNTYLTMEDEGIDLTTSNDIHVVHSTPSDIVDPRSVNFDTLIEGLAASQSIPHTPSEYGYAEGTSLYKTVEGLLTTEASDATEMIEIKGATADNLSAGTSAWVDGKLILGTGVDNKASYEQGNTDGYEQGKTDGYEQGKTDGYEQGKTDGYEQGKTDGYKQGYTVGKTDGYGQGYTDGYNLHLSDLTVRFGMDGDDGEGTDGGAINWTYARLEMTVPEGYTKLNLYFKSYGEAGAAPLSWTISGCGLDVSETYSSGSNRVYSLNYSGTSSISIRIKYRYSYACPYAVFSR